MTDASLDSGQGSAIRRVERALEKLGRRRGKTKGTWQCPAAGHEDCHPSFQAKQVNGGVRLRCFVGCSQEEMLRGLGLSEADLLDEPTVEEPAAGGERRVVARYRYFDRHGEPLAQKVRYEPKDFAWEVPDGKGAWRRARKGEGNPDVLYNLREVIEANEVHLCEGEKAADRLMQDGHAATCPPAGWRKQYTEFFRGKRVTVWQDRDEPGRKKAEEAYRDLLGVAASVRVVQSKAGADKADAFDHLEAGYGIDEAVQLMPNPHVAERATILSAQEFESDELPPAIVEGLVHEDALISVTGASKAGKSIWANQLVMAAATGARFLGLEVRQSRVLLASLEMAAALVRDRMQRISRDVGIRMPKVGEELFIIAPTRRRTAALDLTTVEGLNHLVQCIENTHAKLVVLDTLYKFCLGADPNDNAVMGRLFSNLSGVAQTTGAALLVLDHVAKGAGGMTVSQSALGAQIKGAAARTIVQLRRLSPADGGSWELNVESHFGNWDQPIMYRRPTLSEGGWGFGCVRCSATNARGISGEALRAVFMKHGERESEDGAPYFPSQTKLIDALRAEGFVEGKSRDAAQKVIRCIEQDYIAQNNAEDKIRSRYPVWQEIGGRGKPTQYTWMEWVWEALNR